MADASMPDPGMRLAPYIAAGGYVHDGRGAVDVLTLGPGPGSWSPLGAGALPMPERRGPTAKL